VKIGKAETQHDETSTVSVEPLLSPEAMAQFEMPLDPGIERAVRVLMGAGVETFESCQGGSGHAYPEPTVRFHGERSAGWRALTAAQEAGLQVLALRRTWPVNDGEPNGPYWEIVFRSEGPLVS